MPARWKNFTSQFREDGEGNTESAYTGLDSEEKRHDSMCRGSEGKTEQVSGASGGGKSFAARFTAARVKPGCRGRKRKRKAWRNFQRCGLGKTEPRS